MHDSRLGNLLGAAALAVSDLMITAVRAALPVSVSGAGALVVLAHSPGLSVTELGRRVGLSQPAAARMVDSLQDANLVRRTSGAGRAVPVELTAAGEQAVAQVLAARGTRLSALVASLDDDEQRDLAGLLEKLLAGLYGEVGNAELLCRLCDRGCCVASATCPVGQAERDSHGPGRT